MMKVFISILILQILLLDAFGQATEESDLKSFQWYVYFKAGVKQNLSNYQNISAETERIMNTPNGFQSINAARPSDVELNPEGALKFVDYSLLFPAGLYVVSPFLLTTGIEYQPIAFRNVYYANEVDNQGYFYAMDEVNTLQTIAIPLFVDTRPIYDKFTVYGGVRFHFNLQNWQLQKVSFNEQSKLRKVDFSSEEFSKTQLSYALGFNYSILSVEFLLHQKSFLNQDFTDEYGKKPYSHLDQQIKSISVSILIGKLRKKKESS